jgi:hypothetical protein
LHTLTLDSHIAVLDPATGMGLLVLPDPVLQADAAHLPFCGQAAHRLSSTWFGPQIDAHLEVLHKLSRIGWELPHNNEGAHAWFDGGFTDCCGRTMISMLDLDFRQPEEQLLQDLIAASRRLQEHAASACCVLCS